ncbi:MAG: type II toxin-antitoxin system VapC family toxin [Candidatus Bathyarchaeia archaeon]
MDMLVLDASVIVRWYVVEDFRDKALAIRNNYVDGAIRRISAPMLMPFEVINAIKYSRRDISVTTLKSIVESLAKYGFNLYELSGEYAHLTIDTALENNITIYDACYVALAEYLDTVLYTADRKLIESLKEEYRGRIKHIKEYAL